MRPSRPSPVPVLAGLLLLAASGVSACTIPVFRYALDRWTADPFHVTVPTSWSRAAENEKAIGLLRAEAVANVELKELQEPAEGGPKVLFPREMEHPLAVADWSEAGVKRLLDSPARQELVKRIVAGESAVWVMVEGGDPAEDDAFAARLKKRLSYLKHVASLPQQDPHDPDSKLGPGPPLRLEFSVLRLSRTNEAEQALTRMLAGPEGAKFAEGKEPFAAPVFGRGRVLGAWTASELDDTAIEDTSLFLIGRCSCRVKNENPGWDILLKVDWDRALEKASALTSTPEPALEEGVPGSMSLPVDQSEEGAAPEAAGPVTTTITSSSVPSPTESSESKQSIVLPTIQPLTVAGVAVVLAGLALMFLMRKKP